jgi:hypothetical protein
MSRSNRPAVAAEEGSALVIVLAFITFVGLVVMATLSYAGSSFALSATSRDIARREAAADGGAKFAVAQVITDVANCTPSMAGAPLTNGYTPAVSCESRASTAYTDSTGWGVFIDEGNGQIATQSGGGSALDARAINGPVYNGSTASNPWDLKSSLLVSNGGVLQHLGTSGCVKPSELTIQGTGSLACTPPVQLPDEPSATQKLPSSPDVLPDRPATGDGGTGSCRVFEPGRYASAPQLLEQNYFRSGVYLFEHGIGAVGGKKLLAGKPPPTETALLLNTAANPNTVPCAVAEDTTGVQFIFGGDGYLFADNGSDVEIHSMAKGDATGTSIYRLRTTDPEPWRPYASTRGLGSPILESGHGTKANIAVHGLVFVPGGSIVLEGKNSDITQIMGGVVAGSVTLQASASMAQGVQIHAGEEFSFDLLVIRSTVSDADGKAVTVSVALRVPEDDPSHPVIYSWTVH